MLKDEGIRMRYEVEDLRRRGEGGRVKEKGLMGEG